MNNYKNLSEVHTLYRIDNLIDNFLLYPSFFIHGLIKNARDTMAEIGTVNIKNMIQMALKLTFILLS